MLYSIYAMCPAPSRIPGMLQLFSECPGRREGRISGLHGSMLLTGQAHHASSFCLMLQPLASPNTTSSLCPSSRRVVVTI